MPWVKLDDGFHDHPKARAAGVGGRDLFSRGLGYAAKYLTDGFIPSSVVNEWLRDLCRHEKDAVSRLLHPPPGFAHGLWEVAEGGYRIHDYLDYSPSRAEVIAERAAAKERKRLWKERHPEQRSEHDPEQRPEQRSERSGNGVGNAEVRGPTRARVPVPSRPVPSRPYTPTPTPSPPGQTVPGPPGEGRGVLEGSQEGSPDEDFQAAYTAKIHELIRRFGHPLPPEAVAERDAWEAKWRTDHGMEPREDDVA